MNCCVNFHWKLRRLDEPPMKVLEDVSLRIRAQLPLCKSRADVQRLLQESMVALRDSNAPFGQRQNMWRELQRNLSVLNRRPDVVTDAHAIIEDILKRMV